MRGTLTFAGRIVRRAAPGPVLAVALSVAAIGAGVSASAAEKKGQPLDFNREIRPILSNHCFQCHGPDAKKRKGVSKPLRLDNEEGAFEDLGGYTAIVRGKPDESELIQRITSDDSTEKMPPPVHGRHLSTREIETLTDWVRQGAPYAKHWSYVKPVRYPLPDVHDTAWPRNAVDRFILERLEREGLKPAPEADRYALVRRLALDLTGLPPTVEEVEAFVNDSRPDAYERLVTRFLDKESYGEHWARMWLDLARYADSAGYADDPGRTIWAYRDYVIRSLNANKPFDQFTLEQVAGDLLPNPTEEQLVATAFHRNTLTNNEGGTNDEEYRSVAIVDRVNTTMAVWMGTTIACAQCHDHKYDPLSQREFFQLYAFFNNTADADRTDESPLLSLYTSEQKQKKEAWQREIAALEADLRTPSAERLSGLDAWKKSFATELPWHPLKPAALKTKSGTKLTVLDDGSVLAGPGAQSDIYTVDVPLDVRRLSALRLETLTHDSLPEKGPGHAGGNFVVSQVLAAITPKGVTRPAGRYVRIELPGKAKILSLAEVQVFRGTENVARLGASKQSSVAFDGPAKRAIDGKTDGRFEEAKSTTHTDTEDNPWWEVDLKDSLPIDKVVVWNRTDANLQDRLNGFHIVVLDEKRQPVWTEIVAKAPRASAQFRPNGVRTLTFTTALADYAQPMFEAASVLDNKRAFERGWAVGGQLGRAHALTLVPASPVEVPEGATLSVTIEQLSKYGQHTIGHFRLSVSDDERAVAYAQTPEPIRAILKREPERRSAAEREELAHYYLAEVAPELKDARTRLATLKKELAAMKPGTTVPIQKELAQNARRMTKIQHRGNFLDLGPEVSEGTPAVFPALAREVPRNRLALAQWLVNENNPLTGRVIANRYWEQIFGIGIVPTSEEFGSQGELPTHPELLDWLATELVREHWDLKRFLTLLVTSATYRQSSRVTPDLQQRDPENQLLARGPRFRLSAEMIRDQALFLGGLLSPKMYGPPVKPQQPILGVSAAFGGGIDWVTSTGDDQYRRGLYTTWRRSNPYPSMATFDAPNREVCTLRRSRTNTPLQALVTMNDPVYVEASQGLARRMAEGGPTVGEKARHGFRICLARSPSDAELDRLVRLFESARAVFLKDRKRAGEIAGKPLAPKATDAEVADQAAWTVVGNVLLNMDETLMKR